MQNSILLLLVLMTFECLKATPSMGPIGKIILRSIDPCEEKYPGDDFSLNVSLRSIDNKGTKALFGTVIVKTPIDSAISIRLQIFKWVGGWQPHYDFKGKFCRDIKLLGKVFEQLVEALEPPVSKLCPYKPGTYVVKNFQASSKDLAIPLMFYGKLFGKFTLMNKSGKVQTCQTTEFDSQAPA